MDAYRPLTIAPRRSRLAERMRLPYMDPVLLGASVGLACLGVITLAGVGGDGAGEPANVAVRQGVYAAAGVVVMIVVGRLDYSRLRDLRIGIYAAVIASILAVFLFGVAVRGSHRWLELPYFRFQPSELAKVLLCVSLAAVAVEGIRRQFTLRRTLGLLALGLAPAGLVALQPDLGGALIIVVLTLAVLFVACVPWQHLAAVVAVMAALAAGVLALAPAAGINVLHPYQEDRLTAFLNPSDDPADESYQVNQAMIAVGSGEATGRGDDATQTELRFLPERNTDLIFAALAERFGFLGGALALFLYSILFWRAGRVMVMARSFFGTLIAAGILAMLVSQVLINIGMNLGIMPVTGITLPLLSYGGSSMLATFLALGLLQAIHVHARRGASRGARR